MTLEQLAELEQLRTWSPMPWYLEQDNDSGIEVRDNHGDAVFFEDFGSIPDEAPAHVREQIIAKARTLARFLVVFSKQPL